MMHTFESTPIQPFEPERLLVVQHPRCPNLEFGRDQIEEVRDDGSYNIRVINTEPAYEATEEKFYDEYRPGDLPVVIGGEGTTNRMYNIIRHLPLAERNLLGIGGGNACDYRATVNRDKRLLQILKTGQYTAMRALQMDVVDMEAEADPMTMFGLVYVGLGGTAKASHAIEQSKRTSNAFTRRTKIQRGIEAVAAWWAVGSHPKFHVTTESPAMDIFKASDFSAFNGDRVAVYGRPHGDIFDTESFTTLFSRPFGMPGALIDMLKMQQGKSPDELQDKAVAFSVMLEATRKKLWAHYDGEARRIPSYSHVTVGLAPEPYFTLSTRWDEQDAA